ncbi:hypothetical protein LMG27177_01649 [Paraburkholderia fynbosensis]|uniref:Uncharacterized protein n=1 Tax=Paraburkholderia fynbosensis TaxID=1200993 RepID=A0A6J5FPB2_9BURK|nr:hypothetical protein LMG27177_01649 [Paraburkholderia fynbosensis]
MPKGVTRSTLTIQTSGIPIEEGVLLMEQCRAHREELSSSPPAPPIYIRASAQVSNHHPAVPLRIQILDRKRPVAAMG